VQTPCGMEVQAPESAREQPAETRPSQRLAVLFNSFATRDKQKVVNDRVNAAALLSALESGNESAAAVVPAIVEQLTGGAIRTTPLEHGHGWLVRPSKPILPQSVYVPLRSFSSKYRSRSSVSPNGQLPETLKFFFSIGVVVYCERCTVRVTEPTTGAPVKHEPVEYIGLTAFEAATPDRHDSIPDNAGRSGTEVCLQIARHCERHAASEIPVAPRDVVLFAGTYDSSIWKRETHGPKEHLSRPVRRVPCITNPILCLLGRDIDAVICSGLDGENEPTRCAARHLCERVFDRRLSSQKWSDTRCRYCTRRLFEKSSRTRRPELNAGIVPRAGSQLRRLERCHIRKIAQERDRTLSTSRR